MAPSVQRTAPSTAPPRAGARSPRLTLSSIVTSGTSGPFRLLVHGVEKVGKSALAARAPAPIFVCPEDGLPPEVIDTPHFPVPEGGWTWSDVIDAIRALAGGGHTYRTLVIDTADWVEPLLWAELCDRNGWNDIEEPGYGKGYAAATSEWRRLVAELEALRRTTGMNVIILAHSVIRAFKDPESEGWDRYEMKIHKAAAGLLSEWVDAILFAKHEQVITKDKRTKRARGISTGARLLFTAPNAAYLAGNRYGLPEVLPLSWPDLEAAIADGPRARIGALKQQINEGIAGLSETDAAKATSALDRAGDDATKLAQLANWVNAKQQVADAADSAGSEG